MGVGDTDSADPLVDAIQKRNQDLILDLITTGYPIEGRTEQKNEPAYWAIINNNQEALKTLIEHGLDLKTDWGFGRGNLLTNAVQFGHMDITKLLVESGTPVTRESKFGRSPLYASIIYEKKDIEEYLRSKGAQLNDWDMAALDQL